MTHMAHMDETYLHLVTSLLMEKDSLFRADRSDSMTSEDRDDFLPLVSEFLIPQRDRAFSWDVSFEEGLSGEAIQALIAEQTRAPFFKPMPPPTVISSKLHTVKSPAVIEDDQSLSFLFSDASSKKESLPIKKRKIPEKNETSKKTKAEIRNEKLVSDIGLSKSTSDYDSDKLSGKKPDQTIPGKRQHAPSLTAADTKIMTGKKIPAACKPEERTCQKSESLLFPSILLSSNAPSSSSFTPCPHPKGLGLVTPIPASYQHHTQATQPVWNDFIAFQPTSIDVFKSTSGLSQTSVTGLQPSTMLSRIPLLASDFGPANGIAIGDGCRVGVYTREERLVRIERFREKKLKRIWRKQIKYDCRKRLADTRPRVKGRFVSRIGENGEELPPEPKPESESLDSKKKKKKVLKSSPGDIPDAAPYSPYDAITAPHTGPNAEGVNSGDTTQESEEDACEDAGDSICSDAGDSLNMHMGGELQLSRLGDNDHDQDDQNLDDSLGHIIDIICGDDRNEM